METGMIKLIFALVAVAVTPFQDSIQPLLDEAVELIGDRDLVPTGWVQRGTLAQGGEQSYTVTLKGGSPAPKGASSFEIAARCDDKCGDINLYVTDSKGKPVDSDTGDDDFPIVAVEKPGKYNVRVEMKACSAPSCAFGVLSFRNR